MSRGSVPLIEYVYIKEEPQYGEHNEDAASRVHENEIKAEPGCASVEHLADQAAAGAWQKDPLPMYAGHEVNEDLAMGPERLQLPAPGNRKVVSQRCSHSGVPSQRDCCKKTRTITHKQLSCDTRKKKMCSHSGVWSQRDCCKKTRTITHKQLSCDTRKKKMCSHSGVWSQRDCCKKTRTITHKQLSCDTRKKKMCSHSGAPSQRDCCKKTRTITHKQLSCDTRKKKMCSHSGVWSQCDCCKRTGTITRKQLSCDTRKKKMCSHSGVPSQCDCCKRTGTFTRKQLSCDTRKKKMWNPGSSNGPLPGNSNRPVPGNSNEPVLGNCNRPVPGNSNKPVPGKRNRPVSGNSKRPVPGNSNRPVPGNSNRPVPGSSNRLVPGNSNRPVPGSSNRLVPGNSNRLVPGNSNRPVPGNSNRLVPGNSNRPVPGDSSRSVPSEIDAILQDLVDSDDDVIDSDDDVIDSDDDVVMEEVEEHWVQEDGSLVPVLAAETNPSPSEDEELELAYAEVRRCISPLTRPGSPVSPPLADAAGDAPMPGGGGAAEGGDLRGWITRGRGRRGRGGNGMRDRGVRGAGAWLRSDPLVERFEADQVVPAQVREDIERLTDVRNRRERAMRKRRVASRANVEEASDEENDEEELFDDGEFVWEPMADWNGQKESFLPENSGPTRLFSNAYDAFRSYWDDTLLSYIVDQTNQYAQGIRSERFHRDWFNTNLDEILILFAFWMMLGIIRMPTIKSCFSTLKILRTEIFRCMFSQNRYWILNRAFQLKNGSRNVNDPDNLLYHMGPVIDQLNTKFQQNYTLHQDICIDESLTLWKGPGGFRQRIRTKRARIGIKTFQLCESSTGYLYSFFVYTGRRTTTSTIPSSIACVVKLMQPLLNLGHVLYMDNWFNSPTLARYLKRRRTDCVGTLRSNRRHLPALVQRAPLAEGEFVARQSGDVMVVTLQDRHRVTCISTFHGVDQVQKTGAHGRPAHYKLKLINDYNQHMGGVDRLDQMLEPYLIERKQCRYWSRKLFKRLLNISIQNARVLLEKSSNTTIESVSFRLALVQSILDHHRHNVPTRNPQNPRRPPPVTYRQFPAERLTERHFIRRIPITDEMRTTVKHRQNLGRRQCVWCSANGRKKSTIYECPQCNVPLCLDFCFQQFHTIP